MYFVSKLHLLKTWKLIIGTQTEAQIADITHTEQNSVATQCNLLDAPPLKLQKLSVPLDDSFASKTEQEETDLDTSFCCSQQDSIAE